MASGGDDFWRRTQVMLQGGEAPLVRKPKLTENLLRKPPFRFLHDVISEVQRQTGFAPRLFSEAERNSANVKDKQSKVDYLNKIIEFVAEALGRPRAAKALKVVAGLEPENTNRFLQELAEAATGGGAADGGEQQDGGAAAAADESMEHAVDDHDDVQAAAPSKFGLDDADGEVPQGTQRRRPAADAPLGDAGGRPSSRGDAMAQGTMRQVPGSPGAGADGGHPQPGDDPGQAPWPQECWSICFCVIELQ